MKINNTTIEKVNKIYNEKKACRFTELLNLRVDDLLGSTSIINNNWEVVKLEDLANMIESLTAMKEAIEEATGIIA